MGGREELRKRKRVGRERVEGEKERRKRKTRKEFMM